MKQFLSTALVRTLSFATLCSIGFIGVVSADTVNLGTSIGGLTGSTIYNSNVQSYNYGLLLGSNPTSINNSQYQDTTYLTGSIRASSTTANNFAALGVAGGEGTNSSNFVLGAGSSVSSITTGTAASGQYSPTTYHYNEVMNQWVQDNGAVFGADIHVASSSYYLDGQTSGPVAFQINTALGLTNTIQGSSYSCGFYTCYTQVNGYTNLLPTNLYQVSNSVVYVTNTKSAAVYTDTYVSTDWTGSIGTASVGTSYAVNTTGSLTLNGGDSINGNTIASGGINILGSANSLNGNVTGNITYGNAGSVTIGNGGLLTGSVNFAGNNGILDLSNGSNVTGNIDTSAGRTGTLIFENNSTVTGSIGATAAIKELDANGTGVVIVTGGTKANTVNLNAAGTVAFGGGLDTRLADNTLGTVSFNNYNGTVQIGAGSSLFGNVVNSANNLGTLTFVSGTQSMNGQIGTNSNWINTLNIGGVNSGVGVDTNANVYSTTTANGNIFATSTILNNKSTGPTSSSSLILANGYSLTGTSVTTAQNGLGILTLAGGTQTITGSVGANAMSLNTVNSGADGANSTITGNVYAVNVTNTGSGTSNFGGNINATNVNVNSGTSNVAGNVSATNTTVTSGTANITGNTNSTNITIGSGTGNFAQSVTATTTSIGSGTGNFNTAGGTTNSSNLNFTGAGTANLNQGMTFTNLAYAGNNSIVNVSSDKNLTGSTISTTTNGTGYLNMLGGSQTVNATVGALSLGLNTVTAGVNGATTNFTNSAPVYANNLNAVGTGTVNLSGGLTGNLNYSNNVASQNGSVVIASGKNLTGNVTAGSDVTQGNLTLSGGNQTVSGSIGSSTAALTQVNAGANGATTTLSGMTYANTLQFTGNGTVVLNGTNSGNATSGLVGAVNFGINSTNTGTLQIGDGVNLTTGAGGIQFVNANGANLNFAGNSTVNGVVGGDSVANSTFSTITAGAAGKTVTFINDVYVMQGTSTPSTLYAGAGTVNLQGNLYGDLVFNADGTVNVSNGKSLIVTPGPLSGSTANNNTGTINFLGSTTVGTDLGTLGYNLKAVNFHSDNTVGAVTQNLGYNIYTQNTTIGNNLTATTANVNANIYLGNNVTLAAGNTLGTSMTTLNTAGSMGVVNGSVVIGTSPSDSGFIRNVNGTLSDTSNVTKSTFGTGALTTNGGTLNFAVGTSAGGTVNTAVSSSISGGAGSSLVMNGSETVNVAFLGSLRNGQTYNLINTPVAQVSPPSLSGVTLTDNSYVIDSSLSRDVNGDLVVTTSRNANTYVAKSGTAGNYTNNAAIALGTLAAAGTGYTSNLQTVLNELDINQWGYGNNQSNLATQIRRLAPTANLSSSQGALTQSSMSTGVVGTRMANLRGDTLVSANDLDTGISAGDASAKDGVWLKALGGLATQKQNGQYDGYNSNSAGVALGFDHLVDNDLLLGLAASTTGSNMNQTGFSTGNNMRINSYQATAYGSYDINKELYIDGAANYATNKYSGNRLTVENQMANESFNGNGAGAMIGVGYKIDLGDKAVLTPKVSLDYAVLKQNAYTETNAGDIGLNVNATTYNRLRAGIGGLLTKEYEDNGMIFRPELALNYYHDSGSALNAPITASYIGGGGVFTTPSSTVAANLVDVGLGVAVLNTKSTSFKLRYDILTGQGFTAQSATLTGRYAF